MNEILGGRLVKNGKTMDFGHFRIMHELARGASGVVYVAHDELLDRDVAIKLWTKLRANDRRDKISQGLQEARKASRVDDKNVVEIFHAGISEDVFFMVMELLRGMSLKDYLLTFNPPLQWRLRFARELVSFCDFLYRYGTYHGDLHSGNVIVQAYGNENTDRDLLYKNYKIIDFGTSYFTDRGFSMKRHLEVFVKLIDELSRPFLSQEIYDYEYPRKENWESVSLWLKGYLSLLPTGLIDIGYRNFGVFWIEGEPVQMDKGGVPPRFRRNIQRFLKGRALTNEEVGEWWARRTST